jgi:hypothetical protein
MRKYTTKSLYDRVEYLDAEVDRLAARLLALESVLSGSSWTYQNYASWTDHQLGDFL